MAKLKAPQKDKRAIERRGHAGRKRQNQPVDCVKADGGEKKTMSKLTAPKTDLDRLELLDRDDLIAMVKRMVNGGISLGFYGKRTAMEIARRVRPRVTRRMKDLHVGTPEDQSQNLLIEGENLQAMVTLYKLRIPVHREHALD